jgi:hypothetical protein
VPERGQCATVEKCRAAPTSPDSRKESSGSSGRGKEREDLIEGFSAKPNEVARTEGDQTLNDELLATMRTPASCRKLHEGASL